MSVMRIGWCVSSLSLSLASVRYRAVIPMFALDQMGHAGVVFTHSSPPSLKNLDAIVFVKHFHPECYRIAQEARRHRKAVVLDLCDNIFIDDYGKHKRTRPSDLFLSMATQADAIVVTTEPLARVVREKVGDGVPVFVVPDGIDDEHCSEFGRQMIADARQRSVRNRTFAERLRTYLNRPDSFEPKVMHDAIKAFFRTYLPRLSKDAGKTALNQTVHKSDSSKIKSKASKRRQSPG